MRLLWTAVAAVMTVVVVVVMTVVMTVVVVCEYSWSYGCAHDGGGNGSESVWSKPGDAGDGQSTTDPTIPQSRLVFSTWPTTCH